MIACSPDDLVEMNGMGIHPTKGRGITEYKCPFKGGFPCHYKTIPPSYYIQTQLNMLATSSSWCHLVVWTPKTTQIYLILRDDQFLENLLYVTYNHFWVLQTTPSAPHTTLLDVKMQAEKKSSQLIKLTEVPSLCATSCLGKFSQFGPQNVDSLAREKKKPKANNCKRKAKHCSKCHRLLTVCNKDKCKGKQTATRRSLVFQAQASSKIKPPTVTPAATPTATPTAIPTPSTTPAATPTATPLKEFPSFRNGSGGILNSCHQDALLVILNEIFIRNPQFLHVNTSTSESRCMKTLKEMHQRFKEGKFHESKMQLWTWLQNSTPNGRMYYGLGKQCSLEAILPAIRQKLSDSESTFLRFSTKTSKQCLSHADHAHPTKEMLKATYRIVEENFIPEDRVDNKDTKSPVNITKHFQRLAADTGTTWLSASCSKVLRDVATDGDITECVRCNSPASCNTKIERLPEVIVLETVKKNDGPLPYFPHLEENMVVRGIFYQLVGLVYYSRERSHYWSDVYVKDTNTRNIVTRWNTHDGLNNSGNALLAGGPSFSSDGRFLSLVFYEKVHDNDTLQKNNQKTSPKQKQHTRTWHQSLLENSGLTPPHKK